jgi:hypothetical protein
VRLRLRSLLKPRLGFEGFGTSLPSGDVMETNGKGSNIDRRQTGAAVVRGFKCLLLSVRN